MGTGTHEEEQMADSYDRSESAGGAGFMMGLLAGTVLGAGLGMLLAPSAGSELRGQLGERARNLGNIAADQYKKAGEAANDWAGRVGLLFALEPVFALLFALTLGGEHFDLRWWAGAALILGAVALVEWRQEGAASGEGAGNGLLRKA